MQGKKKLVQSVINSPLPLQEQKNVLCLQLSHTHTPAYPAKSPVTWQNETA
jgi:hypothetical protein